MRVIPTVLKKISGCYLQAYGKKAILSKSEQILLIVSSDIERKQNFDRKGYNPVKHL